MRSAALTALERINRSMARRQAFDRLNKDPALMVRAKALDILQSQFGEDVAELFWKKFHSADSFHNNRSLWIRKNLAVSLMKNPRKKDTQCWIQLLHGPDEDIQQVAALALSKINNHSSPNKDVSFWKKPVSE